MYQFRALTLLILFTFFFQNVFCQSSGKKLIITPLTKNFYVYTTFGEFQGSQVPANGLYMITKAGAVIFDSPWDTTQFQPLLDSIRIKHGKNVVICIATHFHDDRTAGLEYYRNKGIKTYTTEKTDSLSQLRNKKRAEFLIHNDTTFKVGEYGFETFYPGEGHVPDNIVIWFRKQRILYGGCLIKSVSDHTLGNLADGNVATYATSVQRVINKFKNPTFVIPGHNDWVDKSSLEHTLQMAEDLKKKGSE
jgi:metallo-beta-lactamase class B